LFALGRVIRAFLRTLRVLAGERIRDFPAHGTEFAHGGKVNDLGLLFAHDSDSQPPTTMNPRMTAVVADPARKDRPVFDLWRWAME
jgi:hypothetical protein